MFVLFVPLELFELLVLFELLELLVPLELFASIEVLLLEPSAPLELLKSLEAFELLRVFDSERSLDSSEVFVCVCVEVVCELSFVTSLAALSLLQAVKHNTKQIDKIIAKIFFISISPIIMYL